MQGRTLVVDTISDVALGREKPSRRRVSILNFSITLIAILIIAVVSFFKMNNWTIQFPSGNQNKTVWGGFYYNLGAFIRGDVCLGHDNAGADITISSNVTLPYSVECNVGTFTVNSANQATIPSSGTFTVFAQIVSIAGTLTADGKGYAANTGPGKALGSRGGGGYGGAGADGVDGPHGGVVYGSIIAPKDKGSGGTVLAGGGAIRIDAKVSTTVSGIITARSSNLGSCSGGAGSGGAVYITTNAFAGAGTIRANGGSGWGGCAAGGGGRVSVIYDSKTFSGALQAFGGANSSEHAPAGTVFERLRSSSTGTLTVANNSNVSTKRTELSGATSAIGDIIVNGAAIAELATANFPFANLTVASATVYSSGTNVLRSLTLQSGGTLTHDTNGATKTKWIDITMNTLTIDSGGIVEGTGLGYSYTNGPGGATLRSSAGHGGNGGQAGTGTPGAAYGSITDPNDLGSSGQGSLGGGLIRLTATDTATINGTIRANGVASTSCGNGPGSGGSVYLNFGTWAGTTGVIESIGGRDWGGCSQAAGGRIAVYYTTKTYAGTISARAGTGSGSWTAGAGTIFEKESGGLGTVTVDNTGSISGGLTPLDSLADTLIDKVVVTGNGLASITSTNRSNLDIELNSTGKLYSTNSVTVDDIVLNSAGTLVTNSSLAMGDLTINSGGVYTHDANAATKTNWIEFTADNVTVNTGGSLTASNKGFTAGNGTGGATLHSSASHGGLGGLADTGVIGTTYGSATDPTDIGSGAAGGLGGGLIRMVVAGTTYVDGTITASATTGGGCGTGRGAGGSIKITTGTWSGGAGGVIEAKGGPGSGSCASGGGGRIAIYYTTKTYTGSTTAAAGSASTYPGGAGTVFESGSVPPAVLTVDNTGATPQGITPLATLSDTLVKKVVVKSGAIAQLTTPNRNDVDVEIQSGGTIESNQAVTFDDFVVKSGGTLTHADNSTTKANWIEIVATTFDLQSGGLITVAGKGYDRNAGPSPGGASGGGAYGGNGGNAAGGTGANASFAYPDDLGSGGGNTSNASSGGGLVKITTSGVMSVAGTINANGSSSTCGGGSGAGGGIFLSTSSTLSGGGLIQANGGTTSNNLCGSGSGGRIALYYNASTFSGTIEALGGVNTSSTNRGGAGTILQKLSGGAGSFSVVNTGTSSTVVTPIYDLAETPITQVSIGVNATATVTSVNRSNLDINVNSLGTFVSNEPITVHDVSVNAGGLYTHDANTNTKSKWLEVTANQFVVATSGTLHVDGKGYSATNGPGAGGADWGGAHAGDGGQGGTGTLGVGGYDDVTNPTEFGSGAGFAGGGLVRITAAGTITVDGILSANGAAGTCGDGMGAGGGVYLYSNSLEGGGTIRANGGTAPSAFCGTGGGGIVAAYYGSRTFNGTLQAISGANGAAYGGAGSVYTKVISAAGTLTVDNSTLNTARLTRVGNLSNTDIKAFNILNYGNAYISSGVNRSDLDIAVQGNGDLYMQDTAVLNTISVANTGTVKTLVTASDTLAGKIDITANTITVSSGGIIDGNSGGHAATYGAGKGTGTYGAGAHGGNGGAVTGGTAYCSNTHPDTAGSGSAIAGGDGGALIKLRSPTLITIDGTIRANGYGAANVSGGAGGGIYISTATLAGTGGVIQANGGTTPSASRGGGGGGCIALYYTSKPLVVTPTVTAGTGPGGNGTIGTIYDAGAGSYPGPY